jgi:hypothetical protein
VVDTSSPVRTDHGDSTVLKGGLDLDATVGNDAVSIPGLFLGQSL